MNLNLIIDNCRWLNSNGVALTIVIGLAAALLTALPIIKSLIGKQPKYIKYCCTIVVTSLVMMIISAIFLRGASRLAMFAYILLVIIAIVVLTGIIIKFWYDSKLNKILMQALPESLEYDTLNSWEILSTTDERWLTNKQLNKYDHQKVFLLVTLGSCHSALTLLEKFKDSDPVYYHRTRQWVYYIQGKSELAFNEGMLAEASINSNTGISEIIQIMLNKCYGYNQSHLFFAAKMQSKGAKELFEKKHLDYTTGKTSQETSIRATAYRNLIINKINLGEDISQLLEEYRSGIDENDLYGYIEYRNLEMEVYIRYMPNESFNLDKFVSETFEHVLNLKIANEQRFLFEASICEIIMGHKLNPTIIIRQLSQDIDGIMKLPPRQRYKVMQTIDEFLRQLSGPIMSKKMKDIVSAYMLNDIERDINESLELPGVAVYAKADVLRELAKRMRFAKVYSFEKIQEYLENAAVLYKENALCFNEIDCYLELMDELCNRHNLNERLELKMPEKMEYYLKYVQKIMDGSNGIALSCQAYAQLAFYYSHVHDYKHCAEMIKTARDNIKYTLMPNRQFYQYYLVAGEITRAYSFLQAVNSIQHKLENISWASDDVIELFRNFPRSDNRIWTIALGKYLGYNNSIKLISMRTSSNVGDINSEISEHVWLLLPEFGMEFDITYMRYTEDERNCQIVFPTPNHPFVMGESNYIQKLKKEYGSIQTNAVVREVLYTNLNSVESKEIEEIERIVNANVEVGIPNNQELHDIYESMMNYSN